jgi:hypothetical protein
VSEVMLLSLKAGSVCIKLSAEALAEEINIKIVSREESKKT